MDWKILQPVPRFLLLCYRPLPPVKLQIVIDLFENKHHGHFLGSHV